MNIVYTFIVTNSSKVKITRVLKILVKITLKYILRNIVWHIGSAKN